MITYIRIPKNASTSLYEFFGEMNVIKDEHFDANNDKYLNFFYPSHCTLTDAVEVIGEDILKNPIFAVVRNPYDRLVSMFFFAKKYNLGSIYDVATEEFDTFAEEFYKLSLDPNFFHAWSQKKFISHGGCEVSIGRFENLEEDVESFINNNNIEELDINQFPKLNSTTHNNYREYYSDKSKEIVQRMWGEDLDCFSYSF